VFFFEQLKLNNKKIHSQTEEVIYSTVKFIGNKSNSKLTENDHNNKKFECVNVMKYSLKLHLYIEFM
jgi:hypothetical protein